MFILGLSFPPKKLLAHGKKSILAALYQIAFTILIIIILSRLEGFSLSLGFFFGGIIALSSTAIVIKLLNDNVSIESVHGRIIVSCLIIRIYSCFNHCFPA